MSVTILKMGKQLNKPLFYGVCPICETEVECHKADIKCRQKETDKGPYFGWLRCPNKTCQTEMIVKEKASGT